MAGTEREGPGRPEIRRSEVTPYTEFSPTPGLTDALKGTFSEPIQTTSPKGESVTVRLSKEGSGQWGIPFLQTNKERAGINHHSLLSARYSLHLAGQLLEAH